MSKMQSKTILFTLFVGLSSGTYGQVSSSCDGDSGYTYPCESLDLNCIRDYFANTGLCTRVSHSDGDQIQKGNLVCYLPSFNSIVYTYDDVVTLFGSAIEKFYVTPDNFLVMSVKFDGLNVQTPRGSLSINQRGELPVVIEDYLNATYSAVLTAIIPSAGLQGIKGTTVTFYNTNSNPPFVIGSKISQSSNPVVSETYKALLADLPTAVPELLLTKAPFFYFVYLQNYICNYGYEFTGEFFC